MKKVIIILSLLCPMFAAQAQQIIGIKGGISGSTMTKFQLIENITPDFKLMPSFSGIAFYEIPVTENFSIQPEFGMLNRGFRIHEKINLQKVASNLGADVLPNWNVDIGKLDLINTYVQVPVLAKFKFGTPGSARFYAMVGPQVSFITSSHLRPNLFGVLKLNKINLGTGIYKSTEIGGIAALGGEFPVSNKVQLLAEARFDMGISRTLGTPLFNLDVRNQSLSGLFGIQYRIGN